MRVAVLSISTGLFLLVATNAHGRVWTDVTGTSTREGDFLDYRDGSIWLSLPNGNQAAAPWQRFSRADQAYVRNILNIRATQTTIPARPATHSVPAVTASYQSLEEGVNKVPAAIPDNTPVSITSVNAGDSSAAEGRPTSTDAEIRMLGEGEAPSATTAPKGKYVFKTECGRFNVILDGGSDIVGTADYRMRASSTDGCDCWPCEGPERLTLLKLTRNNRTYVEAQALTGPITYFRFHWVPRSRGFVVQYSTTGNNDSNFHLFGYAQRWIAK